MNASRTLCFGLALGLWVGSSAASAQEPAPRAERLAFTTLGVGGSTAPRDDPFDDVYPSAAFDHVRMRGWRTLRVGGSVQGDVLGRDGYAEVHLGLGATATSGPFVVSATAGPSIGRGSRGVYTLDTDWPGRPVRVRAATDEGVGLGLRASGQALVVFVPEVGIGLEVAHDQNTFAPTSGARVFLSLGTHRRSLLRF